VRAQTAHSDTRPATAAPADLRYATKGKELLKSVTFFYGLFWTQRIVNYALLQNKCDTVD